MKIRVLCPTRIDLAGGTLDLWPLHAFVQGCKTINAAVSIFTGCEIEKINSDSIEVDISNLKFKKKYKNLDALLKSKDKSVQILKPILNYFNVKGVRISTFSESPVGGGLGGSSSLTISLIYGFLTLFNQKKTDLEVIHLAHNLEAEQLNTPTGTQDYVSPIHGGVNSISYNPDGIKIEKLNFDNQLFNERALIVYTGRPHHSGLNNWSVLQGAVGKNKKCIRALEGIRDTALRLYQQAQEGTIDFKKIFKMEYSYRIQLTKAFTSPEIRRLEKMTSKNGVEAIKICGAGGGGCVVLYCKKGSKDRVRDLCLKEGFQVLNAKVIEQGLSITAL